MNIEKTGKTQLELSSKFWRKREQEPTKFTNEDTVFYMALVHEFGQNECQNPINLSDGYLKGMTGLGTIVISVSRENLKKHGLISLEIKDVICEYTLITE